MGTMVPSTIGPVMYGPFALGVPCSCKIRAVDRLRRHAALEHPAATAKLFPLVKAVAAAAKKALGMGLLWVIALWNSPADAGDIKFALVLIAPADWPPSVTLVGSPPK